MPDLTQPYDRALLAVTLVAMDPGLGGVAVRARAGPVRNALAGQLAPWGRLTRLHPGLTDDDLFGGLDLTATLTAGQPVLRPGLLSRAGAFELTMAERCPVGLAARLSLALDQGAGPLVMWDEGAEEDERAPVALAERLAFAVDLTGVGVAGLGAVAPAPTRLTSVALPDSALTDIVALCGRLGIDSARAPLFALRCARALAALGGRGQVTPDDIATAAALTLAHRATQLPQDNTESPPPDEDKPPAEEQDLVIPQDLLLEAVKAFLPPDLLARLAAGQLRQARGSGTGAVKKGNRRGRPLPARPGGLTGGARIDLVATLRAAAPWQPMRRAPGGPLRILPADLRVKRFEDRSDRLLIFAVDASGSQALTRLAEAKGAVELLLAQAYARRDHVALIAFRGTGAEVLLPPTRSLVQTKRRLAALPGGGGTPLAAGLMAALAQADGARRRGLTPTIALLTDGRANIALDGRADRPQAAADALTAARALRAAGTAALVIDTGQRAEPQLATLARAMGGAYLPLPRADAQTLSRNLSAALDA